VLEPYLAPLGRHLQQKGISDQPISLPVGSAALALSPLEQKVITTLAKVGAEPDRGWHWLIRDAAALKLKILVDLRQLERTEGEERQPIVLNLCRDMQLGLELVEQLNVQASPDVAEGGPKEIKEITEHRRQLAGLVKQAAAAPGVRAAQAAASQQKKGGFVYDFSQISLMEGPAVEEKARAKVKVDIAARRQALQKHRKLILVAAGLTVLFVALLLRLWVFRAQELHSFAVTDLGTVPGIQKVVNRAPACLVVVDGKVWLSTTATERQRATQAVADVVSSAGYRRVEIRSAAGAILAEWRDGKVTVATEERARPAPKPRKP